MRKPYRAGARIIPPEIQRQNEVEKAELVARFPKGCHVLSYGTEVFEVVGYRQTKYQGVCLVGRHVKDGDRRNIWPGDDTTALPAIS